MAFLPILPAQLRRNGRKVRSDRVNPLEYFNETQFFQRFRFSKQTFCNICDIIVDDLKKVSNRKDVLTPEQQLAIALRFYATGGFLNLVGDGLEVDKSVASRIVSTVSVALARKLDQFVKMPSTPAELLQLKREFFEKFQMVGIIGAIDCTHVRIIGPSGDQQQYYINRKGYYSINVQAICDANGRFLNVVADWPGSVHDSKILDCSQVGIGFASSKIDGILLGDSGYATKTWMLTPLMRTATAPEKRYNYRQIRARNVIERTFGVLKRRFHCLHGELRMKPEKVCQIIAACFVLHNIAKSSNESEELDDEYTDEEDDDSDDFDANLCLAATRTGQLFRTHYIHQYLS